MPYKDKEKAKEYWSNYSKVHRKQKRKIGQEWIERNREKVNTRNKEYYHRTKVLIGRIYKKQPIEIRNLKTREWIYSTKYDDLWNAQSGNCPICLQPLDENKKYNQFDHNHITGYTRGLLHKMCNESLGRLGDDVNILKNAIKYLENDNKFGLVRVGERNTNHRVGAHSGN